VKARWALDIGHDSVSSPGHITPNPNAIASDSVPSPMHAQENTYLPLTRPKEWLFSLSTPKENIYESYFFNGNQLFINHGIIFYHPFI